MGCPGIQMWTWTLCVFFCWMHVVKVLSEPHYMVAIPAVLEAGAETRFCVSLLQPNGTLVMTVTLRSQDMNTTLLEKTSSENFHECIEFQVPLVTNEEVHNLQVEVQGDTFYSKKVTKVKIKVYEATTFVQTDKPIYLPGQTVHFRVVSLDSKFRPANQLYSIIELEDHQNKIGQWLNKTSSSKVLQLSYSLNSEAREGLYKITVKMGTDEVYHNFKVEKYVLPKFDVMLKVDDEVSISQEEFKAEVCAKYTYGQPVAGTATVEVCRPFNGQHIYSISIAVPINQKEPVKTGLCDTKTIQTDKNGCGTFIFRMSVFTDADQGNVHQILDVSATVEEEGTGISRPQGKRIKISDVFGRLSFTDTPHLYNRSSNIEGKIKAVYYNTTPIPDMPLYLSVAQLLMNITTDSDGVAVFTLNTTTFRGHIHLQVRHSPKEEHRLYRQPFYEPGFHTLFKSLPPFSKTKKISSLKIKTKNKPLLCDTEEHISIHYTLVKEAQGTVDVMFLILSRGAIIMQGLKQIEVQDQTVNEGEVSFKLKVTPDMAPEFQVVAYAVLPSKRVIAQTADVATEKCFNNKVFLEFSPSSAVPGEQTSLHLVALPGSLCGVSAIDQSVLIKEPEMTLSAEEIFNLLPVKKATSVPHELIDPPECLDVKWWRFVFSHHASQKEYADTVFQSVGLKMITNLIIRNVRCFEFLGKINRHGELISVCCVNPRQDLQPNFQRTPNMGISPPPPPIQTARTFFPETWIWDLVEVGESGTKNVSLTVPDTITTWETETFCLSPQGFGLAPRKKLTVFQPFFLELTLPYSIVWGENFELKATVFNYLTSCIMVKVTAAPSSDYTLTPLSGDQYTSCLCGSESKTLSWTMIPTALGAVNVTVTAEAVPSHASCDNEIVSVPERGRIDVVTRSLRVKAEGREITKTYNWLLCPEGNILKEEKDLEIPNNVIGGSARATVSVLGDILCRALENLDGLLKMPYGCGEQNMALLAPNIYILHYLQNTKQLTPAIKEKALNFLTSGYQKQLNYKDHKGAYSTFGSGPGNTWLTAFVVRSFYRAQAFIYIDPTKIEQSRTWLQHEQRQDGCFRKSGELFNIRMKGGVSDEVTLTAYITASFLEMNMSTDNPVIKKSLICLKQSISDLSNTYTTALLAYVFTLAGDMQIRAYLLQYLDTLAIREGDFIHWSQTASETLDSLSVEISSYVLMAKLSSPLSAEDKSYSSSIVRWLTVQQNQYGGFSSTQDTVVALQALAHYSTLVFSPQGSSTVTVQSSSAQLTFDLNPVNKLLYQEKMLQDVKGKLILEVKGTACAAVQVSQYYNIPTPSNVTTLMLEVKSRVVSASKRLEVTLQITSLYTGNESNTNMMILKIDLLSGFVADPKSLTNLRQAVLVKLVEHKNDYVLVYLDEFFRGVTINHSLVLVQQVMVQNLKPAMVTLYDYYQPSNRAQIDYMVSL
ncbi:alpha-2-macroglobulin-like protein 1 [Melanotaenia boesemani]|uniref:alpha-2-macroglobulin-like protein 1 n=1 Tax=Melanotaenia boesemani TaxID=1250792 RepID=UPI001C04D5AD|nr:alpha-2-macroglobulin-like protein 1 [Melanotaenia boesemani]